MYFSYKAAGIKFIPCVGLSLYSITITSLVARSHYLQKKAYLALVEQEQEKAREEALHQEKLKEEERTLSEALEESKHVC